MPDRMARECQFQLIKVLDVNSWISCLGHSRATCISGPNPAQFSRLGRCYAAGNVSDVVTWCNGVIGIETGAA